MKRVLMRVVTGSLLAAWMVVVFLFSAQPAVRSEKMSGGFAYRIVKQADRLFDLGMTEKQMEQQAKKIDYPVRKGAHMTEYAVLGCLAFAFFCSLTPLIQRKRELWAWCFAGVYAMTDEIHQLSVPGRAGRFTDVCIDATGAAIGIILLFLIRKIWQTCCEKRKHLIQ